MSKQKRQTFIKSRNHKDLLDGDDMNLFESLLSKTAEQALDDTINDSGTNNVTNDKMTTKKLGLKKNFLDVTELIRSIQRGEGNPDCFRRAQGYCDQLGCAWRLYCL